MVRVTQATITSPYVSASHAGRLFSGWPGKGWWVTWKSRLLGISFPFHFSLFPSSPPSPLFLHLPLSSSFPSFLSVLLFLLTQGLAHAKHRLCCRATSRAPRLFLTIFLPSLSLQSSLPLDAKGRNENGTASPSKPWPVVTHVTSNHVSLVSTWVASQDERKATKYRL